MTKDEFTDLVGIEYADEYEKAQLSQEGTTKDATSDLISRQAAIDAVNNAFDRETLLTGFVRSIAVRAIRDMPSAQPEQRYTEEELKVFKNGISLSLLSKRSSQHWFYDEDTATEIEFLERLYEKVSADMRGETE